MFNAPLCYLAVDSPIDLLLSLLDLTSHFRSAANDIEGRPGEKGRHGIEVRAISITTEARRFERNRPCTAKGVTHFRPVPESPRTQLFHQLRQ